MNTRLFLLICFIALALTSCREDQKKMVYRKIPESAQFRAEVDTAIAQFKRGERGMTYYVLRNDSIVFNP